MRNLLYIEFQKLNLFKESENNEEENTNNKYNLSLEQVLKESYDYNIFIEIYKILLSNKVMNILVKILIFFIIILFGLSLSGVFYFIYFILRLIFI